MADTNLAVKMLALGIISKIATGMGQPFDKHARLLTAPVASVCADQKTTTRAVALSTLTAMADAAGGLDAMYTGLGTALESPNPALRASVLGWLAERIVAEPPSPSSDLTSIAGPIISCLEDRNGDVRKGAGAILPFVVSSAGYDFVMEQTSRLKPASKATIVPLINNARASGPSSSSAPASAAAPAKTAASQSSAAPRAGAGRAGPSSPAPSKVASKASAIPAPGRSLAMKALSNVPSARPPSAMSDERPTGIPRPKIAGGVSRPQSVQPPPSAGPSNSRIIPFITSDPAARASRLKRDATRWVLESSPKADIVEYLHLQMEPHTSPEMLQLLYSKDHRAEEDYMAGLALMAEFYDAEVAKSFGLAEEELQAVQMANVDLAVKYAALKLLSNNTQLANRCLEVIGNVISTLMRLNERFSDVEAKLFGPALVYKVSYGDRISRVEL
jgi:cytoskeleton-associated protein 5